jgi:hypothetical protein
LADNETLYAEFRPKNCHFLFLNSALEKSLQPYSYDNIAWPTVASDLVVATDSISDFETHPVLTITDQSRGPFPSQNSSQYKLLFAARPNPFNRGNCFQWKKCLGETIGNMWVDSPEFCGPLGGKSWKSRDGRCIDLLEVPWSIDPKNMPPAQSN